MKNTAFSARLLPGGVRGRLYLLIALTLFPVLLLVFWMNRDRYVSRYEQTLETELEVATGIGTVLDAFISNIRMENYVLGHAIVMLGSENLTGIGDLLSRTASLYDAGLSLNWLTSEGIVSASTDSAAIGRDLSFRPYFREIVSGESWVVSDLISRNILTDTPAFTVSSAIRSADGRLLGVMVAVVEPESLGSVILAGDRPAEGAYSVFDSQGTLVYRNPRLPLTWEERTEWYKTDKVLADAMSSGRPRTGISRVGNIGTEWFLARVPVPGTGWLVGAGKPSAIALEPVVVNLIQSIVLTVLTAVVAFSLSWLVSLSISHPLRQLSQSVSGSDPGNVDAVCIPHAPVEVRDLRDRFAESASELRAFTETLEKRVHDRTDQLEITNRELEAFSYSVSHDLRAPLRSVDGFSKLLLEKHGSCLDEQGVNYLTRIRVAAQRMGRLIDDLLGLSRIGRHEMHFESVNITSLAKKVIDELREREPFRNVEVKVAPSLNVWGDGELIRIVLDNLIGNAWKFSGKTDLPVIEIGEIADGRERVFFVRDNGAGFEMEYADKLFSPFQRLHTEDEFPGTGIGLATVGRIITRHGGRVWAEGAPGKGATVYFTLPVKV